MLQALRNKKNWVIRVMIAVFVAGLMFVFGMDAYYTGPKMEKMLIARVDKEEIPYLDFDRRVEMVMNNYRARLGDNFDKFRGFLNVEQQVVDSLIDDALRQRIAGGLGMGAGTKQVEEKILESPFFANGFTRDAYRQYLRALRMTEEQLTDELKKEIVQEQLAGVLSDLNVVTPTELVRVYDAAEQKESFDYVKLAPVVFEPHVDVSNEAPLREYYEGNKERYRTPKKVKYAFAALKADRFAKEVNVTDEDLRISYEERKNEFVEPRQYKLRKIVFKVEESAGEEQQSSLSSRDAKQKLAEETVEKLKSGESFDKLARERSEDAETKDKGGEMEWQTSDKLPEEIVEAVQLLDRGAFSGVLDSDTELTIVQLDDLRESRQKDFEEVRTVIENDLRLADAPMYAHARAEELITEWQTSGQSLDEFAKTQSLTVTAAEKPLAGGEASNGAPKEMTSRAIELEQGSKELMDLEDVSYFVEVREILEPAIPPFEEIRDKVVKDFTKEKSRELARKEAEGLLGQFAQEVKSHQKELDLLAKTEEKKEIPAFLRTVADKRSADKVKLEVRETKEGTKAELKEEFLANPEARSAALSLTSSAPAADKVLEANGNYFVVQLRRIVPPSRDKFSEKSTEIAKKEHEEGGQRLTKALVQALRDSSDIWVNTEALESSRPL